jgi:hypothetical protein
LKVGNGLIVGVLLDEGRHYAPRLSHCLLELVIGQSSAGKIGSKAALPRVSMAAHAPASRPGGFAGVGVPHRRAVISLEQGRKEER